MNILKAYRLAPWQEAVGTLHQLDHDDGILVATIGPVAVHLPMELDKTLRPYVNQKIAILRTDSSYVWRTVQR